MYNSYCARGVRDVIFYTGCRYINCNQSTYTLFYIGYLNTRLISALGADTFLFGLDHILSVNRV